jgi:hypothetical protein
MRLKPQNIIIAVLVVALTVSTVTLYRKSATTIAVMR